VEDDLSDNPWRKRQNRPIPSHHFRGSIVAGLTGELDRETPKDAVTLKSIDAARRAIRTRGFCPIPQQL
jgi:hypothetical protein